MNGLLMCHGATKPLEYAVALGISPQRKVCFSQNLPDGQGDSLDGKSFAVARGHAELGSAWGNVVDARIQVEGFEFILLNNLLAEANGQCEPERVLRRRSTWRSRCRMPSRSR